MPGRDRPLPPLPPSLVPGPAGPFVGRSREWALLEDAWRSVSAGGRAAVLVGGEPGAGATRLVTEFARARHGGGAPVCFGRCEPGPALPYQPWVMALEHLMGTAAPEVVQRVSVLLRPLAGLIAGVEWVLPPPPAPAAAPLEPRDPRDPFDPIVDGHRLRSAVTELITVLGAEGPVVVVVDDLHHAGTGTLALLRFLARDGPAGSVLLIATFDDTPAALEGGLAAVLATLRSVDGVSRVHLDGLDRRAVGELVECTAAGGLPPARLAGLARDLTDRTGGNPLLVVELWHHLLPGVRGGDVSAAVAAAGVVPEGVHEVVSARLDRLPPGARSLARLVAVASRPVELAVLREAVDLDDRGLDEHLRPAVAAGLVVEVAGAEQGAGVAYDVAPPLVRDAVVAGMSALGRSRANLAMAEALERVHSGDHRPVLALLARHFVAAEPLGDPARARHYARSAATLGDVGPATGRAGFPGRPGSAGRSAKVVDGLTPRQLEVLGLLAEGCSNREIGRRLCISPNTAANHVRTILQRTGCANRTEAATRGMQTGMVEGDLHGPDGGEHADTRVSYSAGRTT